MAEGRDHPVVDGRSMPGRKRTGCNQRVAGGSGQATATRGLLPHRGGVSHWAWDCDWAGGLRMGMGCAAPATAPMVTAVGPDVSSALATTFGLGLVSAWPRLSLGGIVGLRMHGRLRSAILRFRTCSPGDSLVD